jgi:hypothetical protein
MSPGLWDRVPTASGDGRHNGTSFDVSVERRLGRSSQAPAFRAQFGKGRGEGAGGPGFDYRRVMVGGTLPLTSASQRPTVYAAAGVGAYAVTSPLVRKMKPSLHGGLGLDVALGSSPASIGAEIQVHSIGGAVYGTTSLGIRLHL